MQNTNVNKIGFFFSNAVRGKRVCSKHVVRNYNYIQFGIWKEIQLLSKMFHKIFCFFFRTHVIDDQFYLKASVNNSTKKGAGSSRGFFSVVQKIKEFPDSFK